MKLVSNYRNNGNQTTVTLQFCTFDVGFLGPLAVDAMVIEALPDQFYRRPNIFVSSVSESFLIISEHCFLIYISLLVIEIASKMLFCSILALISAKPIFNFLAGKKMAGESGMISSGQLSSATDCSISSQKQVYAFGCLFGLIYIVL